MSAPTSTLVADRGLVLAVERVRKNCAHALETRGQVDRERALFELLHPVNTELIEAALRTAALIDAATPGAPR